LLKDFSKFQKNSRRRSKEIEKDRETQRRENRIIKTNKTQKRKDTEPLWPSGTRSLEMLIITHET